MNLALLAYPGIIIGVFFEGEFFFLSAIIAAHSGHLNLWVVTLSGFIGAVMADSFFFHFGRRKGADWLEKKPRFNKHLVRARYLLDKHENKLLISYRFLYGFRTIIPMLLGTHKITYKKFLSFSILGNLVWTALIVLLGLSMGELIIEKLREYERIEFWAMGILATLGIITFLIMKRGEYKPGLTGK